MSAWDPENGVAAILFERERQFEKGYTVEHDREHGLVLLICAADAYLSRARDLAVHPDNPTNLWKAFWPWDIDGFDTEADAQTCIARAGALIAAAWDVNQ